MEVFTQSVQLHATPLSVAEGFGKQLNAQPRAWIFTSATLAVSAGNATEGRSLQVGFTRRAEFLTFVPNCYLGGACLVVQYSPETTPRKQSQRGEQRP